MLCKIHLFGHTILHEKTYLRITRNSPEWPKKEEFGSTRGIDKSLKSVVVTLIRKRTHTAAGGSRVATVSVVRMSEGVGVLESGCSEGSKR